ncbi:MAG: ABC transporter ATP-binding protein [Halanaerobiales bacterium]|nr:ABC transporter ATP-binding protein [Halanaerobiales bacterium]
MQLNLVEMKNITKCFGEVVANKQVNFDLKPGEIHALLGENGAGKSTLMKILYGMYDMDEGQIMVKNNKVDIEDCRDAIELGIGMVHQHFMLIPQLTVTNNIFLGMKEAGFILNEKELNKKVVELADKYGFNVNPGDYVSQLPVGVQQKIEILKLLIRDSKILILDEPTAVLTPQEVEELFYSLKKLKEKNYSIIFITHKMDEVLNHSDRVTVMRDGESIATLNTDQVSEESLAKKMVGREVFLDQANEERKRSFGKELLKIKNLSVKSNKNLKVIKNLSFSIREGEILGIAGVDGNGQLELGEALTGIREFTGEINIEGNSIKINSPKKLIEQGLSHIPDDRQEKGLIPSFTVKENLILGSQRKKEFTNNIFLSEDKIENKSKDLIREYDIRPPKTDLTVDSLSGGNQQKVILARALSRDPKVIIAIHPTRGLDVGAIEFIRTRLLEERKKGKAILFISTELEEVMALSDRIAVIYEGEFVDIVEPETDKEKIGLMMTGKKGNDKGKDGNQI